MHEFNQSLKYDQRMHRADIRGSIAYAKALALVGILSKEEEVTITAGLKAVGQEWEEGKVCVVDTLAPLLIHPKCSLLFTQMTKISTSRMSVGSASSSVS